MADVLIVGGGVIGLSIAWELASSGWDVTVAEQGRIGQEASWAGAGMLPPGCLSGATTPEARLRAFSHSLWPEWSGRLQARTGIDNGYRRCGGMELRFDADTLKDDLAAWQAEGVRADRLTGDALAECERAVSPQVSDAVRLPDFGQTRNPRHLKALSAACAGQGVSLLEGTPVTGWQRNGDRICAAETPHGTLSADQFVVASGAWSRTLLAQASCSVDVAPMRGQIVLLKVRRPLFEHVLQIGPRYLVPRPDGRILIGSTEERVGFVKQNTVAGVNGLLEFASTVVPELADAEVERCWSGLRPWIERGYPWIGRAPASGNLFVATGHFRSGLQMSPGTAVLMRQLLTGTEPDIDPRPYALPGDAASRADDAGTRSLTAVRS